ncbi:MAG: hypothetical protein IAE77_12170 [Prosthecobacter sp.]|jgi:hypothetical protein|uniref:hypothetical protein n=1 Tax=Prosthecobacter sp. TaxID=1965333 RepID=UPI0019F2D56E|nr:hypothetical protein [Prosthecobacter sp.]MBE2284203.1 hypothetical protein [Prosthecobacter sp.]
MNMNHDAFENDLHALCRRELPAAWRAEILGAVKTIRPAPRTPRWLVAGWSTAWAAIVLMYFTMPVDSETSSPSAHRAPVMPLDQRAALIDALLASN